MNYNRMEFVARMKQTDYDHDFIQLITEFEHDRYTVIMPDDEELWESIVSKSITHDEMVASLYLNDRQTYQADDITGDNTGKVLVLLDGRDMDPNYDPEFITNLFVGDKQVTVTKQYGVWMGMIIDFEI